MRKYLIAAIAAIAAIAFASVAVAQDQAASMSVNVSPKKSGTLKKPANSKLKLTITNNDVHKTLKQLDIQLPKTVVAAGKGFKFCKEATLKSDGPTACPKGSKVGGGSAEAALGVEQAQPQSLHFDVTAILVGKNAIDFYLHWTGTSTNIVAPGRLKGTKKGQKLIVKIPVEAQQPLPQVYAGLVSLTTTLSKKSGKHKLISTVGCKKHKQAFGATLHFGQNPVRPASTATTSASSKCS